VFFFSSRRRHTRCLSDWSSDVCSSDLSLAHETLENHQAAQPAFSARPPRQATDRINKFGGGVLQVASLCWRDWSTRTIDAAHDRSEERRVGKECRRRWSGEAERGNGDD